MISKILVALDDSLASLHALEQVLPFARSEESRLLLVAVVPPYEGDLRIMGKTRALDEQRAAFSRILDTGRAKAEAFSLSVETLLVEGEPYREIIDQALAANVDLIVLNKKNPYPLDLIPMGVFASRVIRQGGRDVLVVSRSNSLTLSHIVLAFDNSISARLAADRAIEMALAYGARLTVVTAFEVPLEGFALSPGIWDKISREAGDIQRPLLESAKEKGVQQVEALIRNGPSHQVIIDAAKERNAGLIVMGVPGKKGLRQFVPGKVMERVICNGAISVWVVDH
jgi:nucleotide-binding universal stress UspA family protein